MKFLKKLVKNTIDNDVGLQLTDANAHYALNKIQALEDYLKVDYFSGERRKPHYRARKVIKKKVGRPKKK